MQMPSERACATETGSMECDTMQSWMSVVKLDLYVYLSLPPKKLVLCLAAQTTASLPGVGSILRATM